MSDLSDNIAAGFETRAQAAQCVESGNAWRHAALVARAFEPKRALRQFRQHAGFTASRTKASVYREAARILAAESGEPSLEVVALPEAQEQASLFDLAI